MRDISERGLLGEFNIRPGGSSLYGRVHVYDSLKNMRDSIFDTCNTDVVKRSSLSQTHAFTFTYRKVYDGRTMPQIGDLWFAKHYLGVEIITHEVVHLALDLCRRRGHLPKDYAEQGIAEDTYNPVLASILDNDEILCYAIGEMSECLTQNLYERGLILTRSPKWKG